MNIYILFGQTATGKTARALQLAQQYDGELVNFDSRQIYKKLDIITGKDIPISSKLKAQSSKIQSKYDITYFELPDFSFKPSALDFQLSTRLWLYDIVDPKESFSSAEFVSHAEKTIIDIIQRGKTPILVGGTGFYLQHLIYGVPDTKIKEDWALRNMLNNKTVLELQIILKEKDPKQLDTMNNSDRNNPRRLIRRIEIINSGESVPQASKTETLSARLRNCSGCQEGLSFIYLPFFHSSSEKVREAIEKRVEARIKEGAIEEVVRLLKEGYTEADPGLNAIGYRQLIAYVKGEASLDEAKREWVTKEVQYAKRQKTYFKKYFSTI